MPVGVSSLWHEQPPLREVPDNRHNRKTETPARTVEDGSARSARQTHVIPPENFKLQRNVARTNLISVAVPDSAVSLGSLLAVSAELRTHGCNKLRRMVLGQAIDMLLKLSFAGRFGSGHPRLLLSSQFRHNTKCLLQTLIPKGCSPSPPLPSPPSPSTPNSLFISNACVKYPT